MSRRLRLAACLAAASLALAACSGSVASPAPAATVTPTAAATPASATASAPTTAAPSEISSEAPSEAAASCDTVDDGTGGTADIKGFAYPADLTVKAGESITWTNRDGAPHTVTFDDGSCASGSIGPGASVTVRYDVAGTFAFHCAIHPQMAGTLVVGG